MAGQTVHLHEKYAKKLDQAFTLESVVKGRLTREEEFVGARTVRISNVDTVPLNDYDRAATANRYGTPTEVGDTVQEPVSYTHLVRCKVAEQVGHHGGGGHQARGLADDAGDLGQNGVHDARAPVSYTHLPGTGGSPSRRTGTNCRWWSRPPSMRS